MEDNNKLLSARERMAQAGVLKEETREATQKQRRKERVPFGAPKQRLKSPDDDNFNYRVFNDNWRKEPNRIKRAMDAGYEPVEGYNRVTVGSNDDGSGIDGVLMRIPKEWYEEDQKLKQAENDKVDLEIRRGTFHENVGDNRYVPKGGIKIDDKLTP